MTWPKSPEHRTAVDAARSAGAVHAAREAWLRFLS
jgi:hypothetical protein